MQENEKSSCGINGCSMHCKHGKMMIIGGIVFAVVIGGIVFTTKKSDNQNQKKQEIQQESNALNIDKNKTEIARGSRISSAEAEKNSEPSVTAGTYEPYDASKLKKAQTGKVVLFFRATWCPSCKALDKDIRDHLKDIPADVTILDVDYDQYADLKKKYNIVTQHTLVEVDAKGKELQKWIGVPTLADLINALKG